MTSELMRPGDRVLEVASLLLSSMVAADNQLGVPVDGLSLLLNQVLGWHDEHSLLQSFIHV